MVATLFLVSGNLACFLAPSIIQNKRLKPLGESNLKTRVFAVSYSPLRVILWLDHYILEQFFSHSWLCMSHLGTLKISDAQLNQNFCGGISFRLTQVTPTYGGRGKGFWEPSAIPIPHPYSISNMFIVWLILFIFENSGVAMCSLAIFFDIPSFCWGLYIP